MELIACRGGCGACCIAPSISSPIPGMPDGKPAGVRCIHLTADFRCAIFEHPERPAVCGSLRASVEMCGTDARQAFAHLSRLDRATRV
ncbi:MAG TPA: YkgJ family cysteine cluster protein [Thermoanaerobaculia bacterium]|nr:YkgJ family cysteine cluster protein [Thermoanaerobaculia bacterium]